MARSVFAAIAMALLLCAILAAPSDAVKVAIPSGPNACVTPRGNVIDAPPFNGPVPQDFSISFDFGFSFRRLMLQAASTPSGAPPCCPTYTVVPGDTIASVAAAQSLVPTSLTTYNNLPVDVVLSPGQVIQTLCPRVIQYAKTTSGAAPAPEPAGK